MVLKYTPSPSYVRDLIDLAGVPLGGMEVVELLHPCTSGMEPRSRAWCSWAIGYIPCLLEVGKRLNPVRLAFQGLIR
jgi:hypothetical protein